ncbi:glycoside hydrolase family 97 catalytic domain-containing protein [Ohtaekwangia kribbensis]|uniref:Glycoside hydrolase family 97 catalytic domain-containing protein n=1 Tax=Ohtaekwangia kribbensis TaxID=688913 RepID=A0ABW3K3Z5_9BACT
MNIQRCFRSLLILIGLYTGHASAQEYTVTSPNGLLKINVHVGTDVKYDVVLRSEQLVAPSLISLTLSNGISPGKNGTVQSTSTRSVNETITRPYGKSTTVTDHFNELTVNFTGQYALIFRAYDEGVAYRFVTSMSGDVNVLSEEASFNFTSVPSVVFPEADPQMRSWERAYSTYTSLAAIATSKFSVTPTLFSYEQTGIRLVIAEADLFDYPGMYLERNGQNGVKGKWAQYPKTVSDPDDVYAYHRVLTREDYLAKTKGTRTYPWRVVIVSQKDVDLLNNELIFKLATPSVISNTSWIKPGKSAWEWWHDAILETTLFPSGLNNLSLQLYKFYIDFAAENKLEYITMDAGWNMSYATQVCQYAASKNVKVIVWDFINLPVVNPARLAQFKTMGAAGVKIDLIERDDQVAINWFEQLAKACAEQELIVLFHGCGKPTGLQRTYPNILNMEAVRGAECAKWDDTPNADYHLQFPFIRMLAGPLDYTPGSMRNVHRSQFTPIPTGIPNTMGTRSHELAMYVIFDQPLGYLCDSPTEYRKYINVTKFLSAVPTTWDKTIPLEAMLGEYAVVARQRGDEWYVGAMTNHEGRNIEIDFAFLPDGVERMAEILRDNDQSDTNAKAYTQEVVTVNNQSKLNFRLSPEGGLVIRIRDLVTGTSEGEKPRNFKVSQNTQHTELTVESSESLNTIYIIDMSGRVQYQKEIVPSQRPVKIDIAGMASGLYVAYGTSASNFYHAKFIK